jgi:urea transport system ATP-binding protein
MLEIDRLNAFYGNSRALHDLSMDVKRGSFMSVIGRNGVGKTTLLRAIMGLMDRTDGSIRLDGQNIASLPTHARAHCGLGYVPQGRGILPRFSVAENLRLGAFARTNGHDEINEELVFSLFPMLKQFLGKPGGNLSGGQQQQLAIGRALLTSPKVMLLDEPTEGIQPNLVEGIEEAIRRLNKEYKITIVLVEQDINLARRSSDTFAIIDKGRVVARGQIAELTDDLVHRHLAV